MADEKTVRIRAINEAFRRSARGGRVVMKDGVVERVLGAEFDIPELVCQLKILRQTTIPRVNITVPLNTKGNGCSGKSIAIRPAETTAKVPKIRATRNH